MTEMNENFELNGPLGSVRAEPESFGPEKVQKMMDLVEEAIQTVLTVDPNGKHSRKFTEDVMNAMKPYKDLQFKQQLRQVVDLLKKVEHYIKIHLT